MDWKNFYAKFQNYVNKLGKLLQETSDDKELEEKLKEMKN